MNSRFPPLALRLAAALSIVFGAASLAGMVASLFRDSLSIDLGFLGIPIGRGLLVGRQSARSWAIRLSGLGLVLVAGIVGWMGYSGQFRAAKGEHLLLSGIYFVLATLVCATVLFGLRSASVRAWFNTDPAERIDSSGWTVPLIFIGALFATAASIRDHMIESSLTGLFPVHTQFEFRDASTGSPISSIGFSSEGRTLPGRRQDPLAPRLSTTWLGTSDEVSVVIKGFSGRPVEVTFTSEGYHPAKYTLNDKSPEKVHLTLQARK